MTQRILSSLLSSARRYRFLAVARAFSLRAVGKDVVLAVGFSKWKENFVRALMRGEDVFFIRNVDEFDIAVDVLKRKQLRCVIWSFRNEEIGIDANRLAGLKVERMEDGFIRSFGRGIDQSVNRRAILTPLMG